MKKATTNKNSAILAMLLVAICNQPMTYAAQATDNGYHSYRVAIGDNFKGIQNEIIIPWAYGATGDRGIGTNTNPEMFF
ncbi:hypothetical protein [Zooshikella harenae]|uniref:Uncharacterized protein n=1 Tax=Zooshikella harenae TaxID=2827238 RepID=A0ABS5ZIX4_9GAMM|nr:hypothetical protein [Zooshikella harenae]MBU2713972.1 hypothetical protein [Zooshikella harenae]